MALEPLTARGAAQPRSGWPPWLRSIWQHGYFYSRTWRASIVSSFVQPVMYLAAMGLGIGALVNKSTGTVAGVSYLAFVAPGLLAGSLLQLSATESTYPVLAGLKWIKTYWAKVATPLSVGDVVIGHLGWVAIRCAAVATIYLGVMVAFGVVAGPLGLLVIPAAVLSAMATAGPITAFSASQDDDTPFALLFRLGVLPMFLFSGVFYPIDRLPRWAQVLADLSPLTHGVHLVRSLSLERSLGIGCVFDIAYLSLWVAVGVWMAMRIFTRKLIQ